MNRPAPSAVPGRRHVGVVASFDFRREEELRRWFPARVECTVAYTGEVPYRDNLDLVSRLADPSLLAEPVRTVVERGAEAVAYLCTACSFARGTAGERALRAAMIAHGARQAVTTSGAVIDALRAVGARRLAVVHPYQEPVARLLAAYLEARGFEIAALTSLGLDGVEDVYTVRDSQVRQAVAGGDHPAADALFVSCTALPTYEAIAPLEEHLGKPVVSANQATAWALSHAVGAAAYGPAQRLLRRLPDS